MTARMLESKAAVPKLLLLLRLRVWRIRVILLDLLENVVSIWMRSEKMLFQGSSCLVTCDDGIILIVK